MKVVLVFKTVVTRQQPQVTGGDGVMIMAMSIPGAPWLSVIAVEVEALPFDAGEP